MINTTSGVVTFLFLASLANYFWALYKKQKS
jgi:hypothetical protein